MARDRWERGHIHHYEYDEPERYPDMIDALKVAEAYVWREDTHVALGIVMVIDGLELYRLNPEHVIAMARDRLERMLKDMPGTHYDDAKQITQDTTYVYTWGGERLLRRVVHDERRS